MSQFTGFASGVITSPGTKIVPVTPSDTVNLEDGPCRALLVGTAGAADLVDASGVARSAVPLQQGYNPIGVLRIDTSNLSADDIWALY